MIKYNLKGQLRQQFNNEWSSSVLFRIYQPNII
jgi:hypothetical protein